MPSDGPRANSGGGFFDPRITNYNPTNPSVSTLQNATMQYLQNFMNNPQAWSQQFQNPAVGAAQTAMAGSAGYNPERSAFEQAMPLLMQMMQRGAGGMENQFSEMQFGNQFSELRDPSGYMNPLGQAMSTLGAATPIFDRNLQTANAHMNTAAPGRFSSALAQEGRDLNATALQDFNLFANQAIQQALGLEQQNRESVRNFGLGARGLQQGAAQNTAQNQLDARGLQQTAVNNSQQNQLSGQGNQLAAMQAMMAGAGQAGNGAFNRNLQSGTFGIQAQQAQMNPIMQMIAGIMGWAQPQQQQAVVGQSPLGTVADIAGLGLQAWDMYSNRNRNGNNPNNPTGQTVSTFPRTR